MVPAVANWIQAVSGQNMTKVKILTDGSMRQVVLARGEKRNALDAEMLAQLTEAFADQPAPQDRVIVLRAEGTVFCAGLDLRERGRAAIGGSRDP